MATIEEKRVYAGGERRVLYLACGLGVASVAVSDDLIGEFGVEVRGEARDVAGADGLLAAATATDVLVGADLEGTGFGAARAVGTDGETVLAADEAGVARYDGGWERVKVSGVRQPPDDRDIDVKRFDGTLAAGGDVYRIGDGLDALACPAEPSDVCVGDGTAFAATDDGLYRLESNGWERELAGPCRVVAAGGDFAVGPDTEDFWGRAGARWERVDLPVGGRVADAVRTPEGTYAVTGSGTVLANAGDGWRSRETGLTGVRALVAP